MTDQISLRFRKNPLCGIRIKTRGVQNHSGRRRRGRRQAAQTRRKKLHTWSKGRDNFWDDAAELEIQRQRNQLKNQYGFLADQDKQLWENVKEYYERVTVQRLLVGRSTNTACHDEVSVDIEAPVDVEHLPGLGVNNTVYTGPSFVQKA